MLSVINCWCNLIKRQNNKDGPSVFSNTLLCHHHFTKNDIKKSFLRWMLLPGSISSQKLPGPPKQERKLPVKQQITIKSTTKRTHKNSQFWRTYEKRRWNRNTRFELLGSDFLLYHNGYRKNIIILESRIQQYSLQTPPFKN